MGGSAGFILDRYSKVLVFAFLVMLTLRGARDLWQYIWAYVLSVGILSYFAIFTFRMSRSPGGGPLRLSGLYTYDANDVGLMLVIGIPLTILAFLVASTRGRWLCGAVLLGIGVSLARTGSRGAFIGLVAVGLLLLLAATNISAIKRLSFLAVTAIALWLAAPAGYWGQMGTILAPTDDYNWTEDFGRKAILKRGLGYLWERPAFGVGVGNFQRAEGTISDVAKKTPPGVGIPWTAPHNSFVQAGAEMGVPGLVAFTVLVIGCILGPLRLRRRLPDGWKHGTKEQRFLHAATIYVPISVVGFAVCASLLSFAYMDAIYLLAAYVTGLYVSVDRRLSGGGQKAGALRRYRNAAGGQPTRSITVSTEARL
jgi:O-antigen ligase